MNIQKLFKKYIVKRPNGNCQILFALSELDSFCEEIVREVKRQDEKDRIMSIDKNIVCPLCHQPIKDLPKGLSLESITETYKAIFPPQKGGVKHELDEKTGEIKKIEL